MHAGVDNLDAVNNVCNIIAGWWSVRPFPLADDGDLLFQVQQMVRWRGRGNTRVAKVKEHGDEGLVAQGSVREIDRSGNDEADAELLAWVEDVYIAPSRAPGVSLTVLMHVGIL